jgi:hypothetical protein
MMGDIRRKTFYVVDPRRGKKEQIFDNDKIAR